MIPPKILNTPRPPSYPGLWVGARKVEFRQIAVFEVPRDFRLVLDGDPVKTVKPLNVVESFDDTK